MEAVCSKNLNMKCIIFLFMVPPLFVMVTNQIQLGGQFERAHHVCQTDLSQKIIEDMRKRPGSQHNYQPSKELVNEQLLCLYVNLGVMSRQGDFYSAVLEQRMREAVRDQNVLNDLLGNCLSMRQQGAPPEKAARLYGCITSYLK